MDGFQLGNNSPKEITVFCDESRPEALRAASITQRYLCIGSIWVDRERVREVNEEIRALQIKYSKMGEVKWGKVSPSSIQFNCELIDLFFDERFNLQFRAIVVDNQKVDLSYHNNDQELGFYKFYYQMLKHKLINGCSYRIYCDLKTNKMRGRASTLEHYLQTYCLGSVEMVQLLPSNDLPLMQLTDLLLGAVSTKFNFRIPKSPAKNEVISTIERHIGHLIQPTRKNEQKFNVFCIEPGMGR
ncbi:DUF3800 domain-containing protein [Corynebacterium diphtheriae]|uniref:DUF3800 domain-containing protein n=1 Tax=Corynebacterium diphtheriae TaxID=1717 RepID=UPI0040414416